MPDTFHVPGTGRGGESPGQRRSGRTRLASVALTFALTALTLTEGCVSSSTWSAWHSTRERIEDERDETTDAAPRGSATAAPDASGRAIIPFASCEAVVRSALAAYPGLEAPRQRARAALAMARAEGALPAPSVQIGTWDFPIGDPSMADREGMYMIGVSQELPPAGSLDGSARASVEMARASLGELDELRREVASGTAHLCADWASAARRRTTLTVWIELLERMRSAVEARLSGAGASLADVARLERERATAARMLARTSSDEARAVESLRAWMGLPASASLGPAPSLSDQLPRLSSEAVLAYALANRGMLASGRAEIAAAGARADAAEARASIPTFMLGGSYMQMPQARAGLGLELGMTLPWLWSSEPAAAEAARAEASAAEAELAGNERGIEVETRSALAALETVREALDVLRTREAPAASRALEAVAATYGAGEGTLLEWLDAARAIRELEIEEAEMLAEAAHALVEVAAAIGAPLSALGSEPLASRPEGGPP